MSRLLFVIILLNSLRVVAQPTTAWQTSASARYVLVIHGGAGTISKNLMTPEREKRYHAALDSALRMGAAILEKGGSSLDAVEASVRVLEDDPLFNAGKGAVFTADGINELDAAIMEGSTLRAGAIAGVRTIRNPISTARAVMERSEHVLLTGKGAETFAKEQGLATVDPSYFYTPERWESLQRAKKRDSLATAGTPNHSAAASQEQRTGRYGTVGAVALDQQGRLAAATSTGGMTNKKWGRVGDAPIIGSGTYANDNTVAISCTGWGEYFLRLVMAKSISDRMEFGQQSLQQASDELVMRLLPALGGDGGLIAVDKQGNIAMPFCTEGMYRGYIKKEKATGLLQKETLIFK
ncbi:MAG: isoaspartyl peptidase/L-asparaginase family protein [Sphingomonadales bacterium]